MGTSSASTSATLLYVERPILNFVRYVDNLEQALRSTPHGSFELTWDNDDYVQFEIDGSRVVLGYCTLDSAPAREPGRLPETYAAALVLSVGPGANAEASCRIAENARSLCQSVIARISQRHMPDLVLWRNLDGAFTADHFDALVDLALELRPANAAQDAAINSVMEEAAAEAAEAAHAAYEAAAAAEYHEAAAHYEDDDDAFEEAAMIAAEEARQNEAADQARRVLERARRAAEAARKAGETTQRRARPAPFEDAERAAPAEMEARGPAQPADAGADRDTVTPEMEDTLVAAMATREAPGSRSPSPGTGGPHITPLRPRRPIAAGRKARPVLSGFAPNVANDMPHLPHPMTAELDRIRGALYPVEEVAEPREKEELVRRLTIYTMNTSLMMVSLPIGGALFTYNILGRENSKVTARVLSLTAIAMTVTHLLGFSIPGVI